jgi:hypothetical protein
MPDHRIREICEPANLMAPRTNSLGAWRDFATPEIVVPFMVPLELHLGPGRRKLRRCQNTLLPSGAGIPLFPWGPGRRRRPSQAQLQRQPRMDGSVHGVGAPMQVTHPVEPLRRQGQAGEKPDHQPAVASHGGRYAQSRGGSWPCDGRCGCRPGGKGIACRKASATSQIGTFRRKEASVHQLVPDPEFGTGVYRGVLVTSADKEGRQQDRGDCVPNQLQMSCRGDRRCVLPA